MTPYGTTQPPIDPDAVSMESLPARAASLALFILGFSSYCLAVAQLLLAP